MWKNIKTVVEKQISSENVAIASYLPTQLVDDHWSWWICTYHHQQTNYSQQTNEQTKVIQEVVSPEVPKLNHAVMNKKRDQMHFSLE